MTKNSLICVAVCTGAFGVRGEIKVKSFTGEAKDCFAYGPLRDEEGNIFLTITAHRSVKTAFAVFADEIKTREQAQALSGTKLYVYRTDMPQPDEDEFYFEDLIGCEVKTTDGKRMGKIIAVHNYGAGDLLEIKQEAKRSAATTGKNNQEAKRSAATTGKNNQEAKRSAATTGKNNQEAKRSAATTGKNKATKDTPTFYHPFTKIAVPKVDIKAGRVVIFIEDADSAQN